MRTHEEMSEAFHVLVGSFQHLPHASVFVTLAVFVGDTDEKGSPLRFLRAIYPALAVAGTSFDIIRGRKSFACGGGVRVGTSPAAHHPPEDARQNVTQATEMSTHPSAGVILRCGETDNCTVPVISPRPCHQSVRYKSESA
jgi:hypothetical protein